MARRSCILHRVALPDRVTTPCNACRWSVSSLVVDASPSYEAEDSVITDAWSRFMVDGWMDYGCASRLRLTSRCEAGRVCLYISQG